MINIHQNKLITIIKPCPFCGSELLTRSVNGGCLPSYIGIERIEKIISETPYIVSCSLECDICGASIEGYAASNEPDVEIYNDAISNCYNKWNERYNEKE